MKGLALVFCMLAAIVVFIAGMNMTSIRSQASVTGAGSIAEAYYQSMGWALIGVSIFLFGAGLGIGGIIEMIERKSETKSETKRQVEEPEPVVFPAHLTGIVCPSCGGQFGIKPFQRGSAVQCPHCKESATVPPPSKEYLVAAPVLPENARQAKWTPPSRRPHEVPSSEGSQEQVEAAPSEKPQEQTATFRARCSKCGEIFEVPESRRGTTVRCPHCQQNLQVE